MEVFNIFPPLQAVVVLLLDEWFIPHQAAKGICAGMAQTGNPMVGKKTELHCLLELGEVLVQLFTRCHIVGCSSSSIIIHRQEVHGEGIE